MKENIQAEKQENVDSSSRAYYLEHAIATLNKQQDNLNNTVPSSKIEKEKRTAQIASIALKVDKAEKTLKMYRDCYANKQTDPTEGLTDFVKKDLFDPKKLRDNKTTKENLVRDMEQSMKDISHSILTIIREQEKIEDVLDGTFGLVNVDMQKGFQADELGELPVKGAVDIVKIINKLTAMVDPHLAAASRDDHHKEAVWREGKFAIGDDVYERTKYAPLPEEIDKSHQHAGHVCWGAHCEHNSEGHKYIEGHFVPFEGPLIEKGTDPKVHPYGAAWNDASGSLGLIEYFRNKGVTTVIATGLATDFCVMHTARQLMAAGFNVIVPTAACRGVFVTSDASVESINDKYLSDADGTSVGKYREMMVEKYSDRNADELQKLLGDKIGQLRVIQDVSREAIMEARDDITKRFTTRSQP